MAIENHYSGDIEPIEVIRSMGHQRSFYIGNIIKYAMRCERKGKEEDVRKLIQYAEWLLEDFKING